jgi:hypothetical protein
MDDPRRVLETAAEARAPCEILPRRGAWRRGVVVRVERGGVVLSLEGAAPDAGADLRCWLSVGGTPWTFEASVLRSGVPVPDRSQGGVLLGFIDQFRRADGGGGGLVLEVVPPTGGPIGLLAGAVQIVELLPDEWTVGASNRFPLVFVQGGGVRLRVGLPDRAPLELAARVRHHTAGEGHVLYRLSIEEVEDPERYGETLAGVRVALGL